MKNATYKQMFFLVVVAIVCLTTRPLYAMPESCFGTYAANTLGSYNTLEQCINETNNDAWYRRLYVRSLCNANWVSDAWQSEGQYVSCMSGFTTLFK